MVQLDVEAFQGIRAIATSELWDRDVDIGKLFYGACSPRTSTCGPTTHAALLPLGKGHADPHAARDRDRTPRERNAHAIGSYPPGIESHLGLDYEPLCSIRHLIAEGTISTAFGLAMIARTPGRTRP